MIFYVDHCAYTFYVDHMSNQWQPSGREHNLKSGGPGIECWHCHIQCHHQNVHRDSKICSVYFWRNKPFSQNRMWVQFQESNPDLQESRMSPLPVNCV